MSVSVPRRRLAFALIVAVAAVAAAVPAGAAQAHPAASAAWAAPTPIHTYAPMQLDSIKRIDPRLLELVFTTPYLDAPTYVRVLLPKSYATTPSKRYPVLYLLDGCCNSAPQARDWTTPASKGDAEKITAPYDVITVMTDCGEGGWYSDWYNNGAGGNPRWESYIIGQLLPWVDAHFRTIDSRAGRAVAGLSMGGFGAMSFAARHPDLFAAAASFSGAVDSMEADYGGSAAVDGLALIDGGIPGSVFGQRATEEVRWRAHNPVDLAGNLRGLWLSLQTGNGEPGPLDTPSSYAAGSLEAGVHAENVDLNNQLDSLGIQHIWDDYGPGTHSWPYWNRDLTQTMPRLMNVFAHPQGAPVTFNFTSTDPIFEDYGYVVTMHRAVLEFASLTAVTTRGFALSGSGSADVVTAPRYVPRATYDVTAAVGSAVHHVVLRADSAGRLHLHIDLGPSNTVQQYSAGTASDALRTTETARVTITDGSE